MHRPSLEEGLGSEKPGKIFQSRTQTRTSFGGFLTVADAASRLGTTAKTVTRWCQTGKLVAIPRQYGNKTTYLISPQSIELLQSQATLESRKASPNKLQELQPHQDYIESWKVAMATGLMTGKPYNSHTASNYALHVIHYFKSHQAITLAGLKASLAAIPTHQICKRQHFYKAIICFGKFLITEGVLPQAFLENTKPLFPKRHIPAKRITVTEDGLNTLWDACRNPMDKALLIFLASTGLRASECCAVKLADLNLEEGFVVVQCGKGGKRRKVGLTPRVQEVLRVYLTEYQPKVFLFLDTKGQQMHRHGLFQRIQRIGKDAGVPVSPHALRRAFVTLNANKGRSLVMLQMACGHSDITTTRSYCLTAEQEVIEAMRGWD